MQDPRDQLHRTKLTLLAVTLTVSGLALMIASKTLAVTAGWQWLSNLPTSEVGSTLFVAGLLSVALDYFDGKDHEARDTARLRRVLQSEAPAIRDAVIEGFAVKTADLARVATPDLLDQIIRNSLALRLGDEQFADEIYTDIRDQAVRAAERWLDASVNIRLSPLRGSKEPADELLYTATVRWEYSVVPAHTVRRFVCVSDKSEYRDLTEESGATSAWYMRPKNGIEASSREAFELVQFTIDGEDQSLRRSTRRDSQTYTVAVDKNYIDAAKPVSISYTLQTIVAASSHVLNIDLEQPTRGISVNFDYGDTDMRAVSVIDSIATSRGVRVQKSPEGVPEQSLLVQFDGWAFPRSGVTFIWNSDRDPL